MVKITFRLWRDDPSKSVGFYELNTVIYSESASSFLEIRSINQLAFENRIQFTEASKVIVEHFYVEDLLGGADTTSETTLLCKRVFSILEQGCLPLRKWRSNSTNVTSNIQEEETTQIGINENAKTLCLY